MTNKNTDFLEVKQDQAADKTARELYTDIIKRMTADGGSGDIMSMVEKLFHMAEQAQQRETWPSREEIEETDKAAKAFVRELEHRILDEDHICSLAMDWGAKESHKIMGVQQYNRDLEAQVGFIEGYKAAQQAAIPRDVLESVVEAWSSYIQSRKAVEKELDWDLFEQAEQSLDRLRKAMGWVMLIRISPTEPSNEALLEPKAANPIKTGCAEELGLNE